MAAGNAEWFQFWWTGKANAKIRRIINYNSLISSTKRFPKHCRNIVIYSNIARICMVSLQGVRMNSLIYAISIQLLKNYVEVSFELT